MNIDTEAADKLQTVVIDDIKVKKLGLGYVALMANGDITLAACPELFGDILTRGHISSSDGCKIAGVTGGLSSQGVKDVYTHNLLAADSVTVKWARSK